MSSPPRPPPPELMGAVRRHPLWAAAPDAAVRTLLRYAEDLKLRPGETLFQAKQPADAIFLLLEGEARMFYPGPERAAEITVVLFRAPAAFGDAEALAGHSWEETVEALTPARALRIPLGAYLGVLRTHPALAVEHYRDIASRFAMAIRRAQNTHFGDVTSRLVALLVSYANLFGRSLPKGEVRIEHVLTREMLALQVGSNLRSVARALADLQDQGLIRRAGRKTVLVSIERLLNAGASLSFSSAS